MAQWASIIVAPLVFLANLSIVYALVPLACEAQRSASLHLANGIALVLTLSALLLAWQALRKSPMAAGVAGDDVGRTRFLSQIGVCISALCVLAIVLQWSAQWFLAPCVG
jgi:hypothetical protein